jgi:5-methylcytosine-specific restriction endonuclease McrA
MSVLNEPVLTLNRNWQPVTFMPVQTAIVNVMRDMASVLDPVNYYLMPFEEWVETHKPALDDEGNPVESEKRWIKTSRLWIPAPEVIVLKQYGETPPRRITFNRSNLARRDDYLCQYCGKEIGIVKMTIDHVLPRSRGGVNSWENCVSACGDCNSRKADKTPKEAKMALRKQPEKPAWRANQLLPKENMMRSSWRPFLEKAGV